MSTEVKSLKTRFELIKAKFSLLHHLDWTGFQMVEKRSVLISFFVHSLQCTLNLLTQVNNNLYKYLRLAEIPVGKTGVAGVKTIAKGICRAPFPTEVYRGLVKESLQ